MPAKSKKQQMAAGAALSAKRGEQPKKSLKGASKQMAESMSEKQLEEIATTKRKKLPAKAESAKTKAKSGSGAKKSGATSKAPAKKAPAKKAAARKR